LNPDTSWRLEVRASGWRSRWNLVAALAGYPFRSPETIARLLAGTELGVARWESFAHRRRVVLLGGADAHARLALTSNEPSRGISLPLPGYEVSFRSLSVHARVDRPLTNDASRDAVTIMQAFRRGHVYTAIDGIASPPACRFTASNATGTADEGDALEDGGTGTLRVRSNAPSSFLTMLWRDGALLTTVRDEVDVMTSAPSGPAIYRAAIVAPPELGSVPWIISNPIYLGVAPRPCPVDVVSKSRPIFVGGPPVRRSRSASAATLVWPPLTVPGYALACGGQRAIDRPVRIAGGGTAGRRCSPAASPSAAPASIESWCVPALGRRKVAAFRVSRRREPSGPIRRRQHRPAGARLGSAQKHPRHSVRDECGARPGVEPVVARAPLFE
jgi:hypothetical protein